MSVYTTNLKNRLIGVCLVVSFGFIVCLTSRVCAETDVQEDELYGVLGGNLPAPADPNEAAPAPAAAAATPAAPAAAEAASATPAAAVADVPTPIPTPTPTPTPAPVVPAAVPEKSAAVSEKAASVGSSAENDLILTGTPTTQIQRDLWTARISASKDDESDAAKNELEQLIGQLNAMEIKPRFPQVETPSVDVEPVAEAEPNVPVIAPQPEEAEKMEEPVTKAASGSVSAETLQAFKTLAKSPDQLKNPLELAEILFDGGCLEEAAACYRVALNRIKQEDNDPFDNKAWIYLQLGNCLKSTDPKAALENYQAVVDEFPYSSWAPLAKTKGELISWYLKDQPDVLIAASQQETEE